MGDDSELVDVELEELGEVFSAGEGRSIPFHPLLFPVLIEDVQCVAFEW